MSSPLISVIVPVFKVEQYIDKCVNSILSQTFKDFELILVDDGSPDSCGEICDKYASIDQRVYVIHKENGGLSDARNVGFQESKGQYITYVDSDDQIDSKYLEIMYNAAKKYNADIVQVDYTKNENQLGETNSEDVVIDSGDNIVCNLFHLLDFKEGSWSKLYSREVAEKVSFPKGRLYEDVLTAYKFAFYSNRFVSCHSFRYYYRINPNGIMHKPLSENRFSVLTVFDEIEDFLNSNDEIIRERKFDIEHIKKDAQYYEFRTKFYLYNECLGKNGDVFFPEQMNKLRQELISQKFKKVSIEKKYILLKNVLKINQKFYKLLACKLRSISE